MISESYRKASYIKMCTINLEIDETGETFVLFLSLPSSFNFFFTGMM